MLLNVHPSGICHFYPPLPSCPTPQQLWFIKLWLQYVILSASWRVKTSVDQEDQLKVAMCQDQLQCLKTSLHTTCDNMLLRTFDLEYENVVDLHCYL